MFFGMENDGWVWVLGFGLLVGFIIDGWIDEVMTFHGMDIFLLK